MSITFEEELLMAEEKTKQDKKVGSWHLGITFINLLMSSIQYQRRSL